MHQQLLLALALLEASTSASSEAAPEALMQLTKLTEHSGARCLDGSPGSYYYSPGRSPDKFLLFMAGGGWCYPSAALWTPEDTDSNCLWRSKGGLGSSLKLAPARNRPGGMLSADPTQSPFADHGLLLVNYCDGGSFTGLRTEPVVQNSTKVYYRGRAILNAVLADAKAKHGLGTAAQVVLSGGSAGGTATVANCDHVAGLLPSARTRCIADAGFFLDTPNVVGNAGRSVMRHRFFDIVDGMNSTDQLHPGCRTAGLDPRLCFFSEHALRFTNTPTFILNSLNNFMTWEILEPDPWAPGFPPGPADWRSCLARGGEPTADSWVKDCNATQRAVISGFRTAFLAAAAPALHAPHGCYLDSCPLNHEQNGVVGTLSIRNQTALATIAQWAAGKGGAGVHVVDQAFPSTTSRCKADDDTTRAAVFPHPLLPPPPPPLPPLHNNIAFASRIASSAPPPPYSTCEFVRPPMGWNSYDSQVGLKNGNGGQGEAVALSSAAFVAKKLKAHGYEYIVLDAGWFGPNGGATMTVDNHGRLLPNATWHPSSANGAGFKPLSDKIHAMGLKFGFWIMGGIPTKAVGRGLMIEGSNYSVDEAADMTGKRNCGWQPGFVWGTRTIANDTQLHPAAVAYYDSVARLYKHWKVDFIKMDCVFGGDYGRGSLDFEQFSESMQKAGQDFLFSLSPGSSVKMASTGQDFAQARAAAGATLPTMARMTGDFWDSWGSAKGHFQTAANATEFVSADFFPE